jgi:peptide subunit release factor RF-3
MSTRRAVVRTTRVVVRVAATTVTTIVMIIFGTALLGFGVRNLLGNWEPVRRTPEQAREAEVQRAIRRLREEIERYEHGG